MKNIIWLVTVLALMLTYLQPGHWAMLGALVLMIVVHEFGHWFVARSFGFHAPVFSIGFGSKPRIVFGKFWGTEFQMTPWLFGGFVQIDPGNDDFRSKAIWKRASVLVAGVTMNVVTAVALLFALYATVGEQKMVPIGVAVHQVVGGSAAEKAGLQKGDEFVNIDGRAIAAPSDLQQALAAHTDGTAAAVTVKRSGSDVTVNVNPDGNGRIGVGMAIKQEPIYVKMSVPDAAVKSVTFTWDISKKMVEGIGMMLKIVPPPDNLPAGATDVHGVVAIVQMGQMAYDNGLYSFVILVVLMSMNLAIFNILPIPVLDGGHLLFLAWEKVTGKAVSPEVMGRINFVFFALLIGLGLLGLYNDIAAPINIGK